MMKTHLLVFGLLGASSGCAALLPGFAGTHAAAGSPPAPVVVDHTALARPITIAASDVTFGGKLAALIGESGARDSACNSYTSEQPIARFRIDEPVNDLLIDVEPAEGGYPQFVVVRGDTYWQQCNGATMTHSAQDWTPGTYDVYATSAAAHAFKVTLTSASTLAAAGYSAEPKKLIPKVDLRPDAIAVMTAPIEGNRHELTFDLTTESMTEVWVRVYGEHGHAQSLPVMMLCDPTPARKCIPIQGDTLGVNGTRRLEMVFERGFDGKTATIQLVPNRKQFAWTDLMVAPPAADAPIVDRDLEAHGGGSIQIEGPSWTRARSAFTGLPRSFVVYAAQPFAMQGGKIEVAAGEPLIFAGHYVLRANGEGGLPKLLPGVPFETLFTTTPPATIVMPPPLADTDGGRSDVSVYDSPYENDIAEFSSVQAPELDAFLRARAPVKACIARELANNGSGFGYDIVQYRKDGSVKNVQSLTSYYENKTYNACNVGKLDKQRVKLRATLRARALTEIKTALETATR